MVKVRRGTKGEVVQARITRQKKERLDYFAEQQDTTSSDILRRLVDEYIARMEIKEKSLHPGPEVSYNARIDHVPIGSQ